MNESFRSILLNEHNRLRANPSDLIPVIEKYMTSIDSDNFITYSNGSKYKLHEGIDSFIEAIEFLRNKNPIKTLTYDELLSKSAQEMANTLCEERDLKSLKLSSLSLSDRLDKFIEWDFSCAENIDFGSFSPRDALVNLLVDDGNPSRSHRENMFREDLNYIGIGISNHFSLGKCLVINYVSWIKGHFQENLENFFLMNPFYRSVDSLSVDLNTVLDKFKISKRNLVSIEGKEKIVKTENFVYKEDSDYSNNLKIFKNE